MGLKAKHDYFTLFEPSKSGIWASLISMSSIKYRSLNYVMHNTLFTLLCLVAVVLLQNACIVPHISCAMIWENKVYVLFCSGKTDHLIRSKQKKTWHASEWDAVITLRNIFEYRLRVWPTAAREILFKSADSFRSQLIHNKLPWSVYDSMTDRDVLVLQKQVLLGVWKNLLYAHVKISRHSCLYLSKFGLYFGHFSL